MSVSREAVWAALAARLAAYVDPVLIPGGVTRRLKTMEQTARDVMPKLSIVETDEGVAQDKGSPALRTPQGVLVLYAQPGEDKGVTKSTVLNAVLDGIDAALRPDPLTGVQDLGGLCVHCWVQGNVPLAENLNTAQVQAALGIHILWGFDNDGTARTFLFDAGALYATPQTDQGSGSAITAPPSIKVAALKGISVELTEHVHLAQTGRVYAVKASSDKRAITAKARFASFDPVMAGKLFWHVDAASGGTLASLNQTASVPAGSPYTVTPAVPHAGTWFSDLGVCFTSDGAPLTRTSGAVTTGLYSVSAGIYTFAAADAGRGVAISYLYTTASGSSLTITNPASGELATYQLVLNGGYNGVQMTAVFPLVVMSKLTVPLELERFSVQEVDMEILSGTGGPGTITLVAPASATDVTAPTATVVPSYGATGVSMGGVLASAVTWTFSEALDPASLMHQVFAWRLVGGVWTPMTVAAVLHNAGASTTITATISGLASGASVIAYAGTGIADLAGNHFAGLMTAFTTEVLP